MNKHDFRRIIHAANKVSVAVAVVVAAGCTNSGLKLGDASNAATQARVPSTERSSEATSDHAGQVASMAMPTLTELKHFVVYQRFHGLLNAATSDGLGAQYSGGSGASAEGAATGQRSGTGDAMTGTEGEIFSCLPMAVSPQDSKEK